MGGRIAPHKSQLFALQPSHREWLARYQWTTINSTVKVVLHLRDLGSHLTCSTVAHTSLSRARLQRGVATLSRIARLPHCLKRKITFIKMCAHSQALYSCEASHIDEVHLRKYIAATAKLIGSKVAHQCKMMAFLLTEIGNISHVHPQVAIFVRRITMLRRTIIKCPA
eukprot:11427376-Karenia_brevis.AAC.1